MAEVANNRIFSTIRKGLDGARQTIGIGKRWAIDTMGTGNRFSRLMAIAPNASSSIIMGNTSPQYRAL
jgi:ribonucleotide reductase alpha subunit